MERTTTHVIEQLSMTGGQCLLHLDGLAGAREDPR